MQWLFSQLAKLDDSEYRKILQRIPHTAASGRPYTLLLVEDKQPANGWPTVFWTFVNENGYGPADSYRYNRFATQEDAIRRLEDEDRVRAAVEDVSDTLARSEYEAACQRAGVQAMSDDKIRRMSYALEYFDCYLPEHSADDVIEMALARARWRALRAEMTAVESPAPARRRRRAPQLQCAICGTPTSLMASLGPACPEHYDELSG